jgi:septal ring factor EnvC (AmiA/AmiB activator)
MRAKSAVDHTIADISRPSRINHEAVIDALNARAGRIRDQIAEWALSRRAADRGIALCEEELAVVETTLEVEQSALRIQLDAIHRARRVAIPMLHQNPEQSNV